MLLNISLMHLMQKLTVILPESAAQALQWLLCLEHQHVVGQTPLLHRHVRHEERVGSVLKSVCAEQRDHD